MKKQAWLLLCAPLILVPMAQADDDKKEQANAKMMEQRERTEDMEARGKRELAGMREREEDEAKQKMKDKAKGKDKWKDKEKLKDKAKQKMQDDEDSDSDDDGKGLEKQGAKKAEQERNELDKGSEQGLEKRAEKSKKWWRFWE